MRTSSLGCFAGAYPANAGSSAQGPRLGGGGQALPIVVAALILLVVLAGIPLAIMRRRSEPPTDATEADPLPPGD